MSRLRDELTGLLDDVPVHVRADAGAAWAAGRRRRAWQGVAAVVCVVVLAALAAGGIHAVTQVRSIAPAGPDGRHVDGLPTRIDHPYRVGNLPKAPGPIAGVVDRGAEWDAVSSKGRLWKIDGLDQHDDSRPALSADGTELGYLTPRGFAIRNLVTGSSVLIPEVGDGASADGVALSPGARYWVNDQSPSFFSPDGSAVLVAGGAVATGDAISSAGPQALLIGRDGSATGLTGPGHTPLPAGWLDDDHVVWVDSWGAPQVIVTDLTGAVTRRIPLDASLAEAKEWGQWVGPVSPDGTKLAGGPGLGEGGVGPQLFSLTGPSAGAAPAAARTQERTLDLCSPSWGSHELFLPVAGGDGRRHPILRSATGPVVLADPRLGVSCSMWAVDALDGSRHGGLGGRLFGMSDSWLSWHWREVGAGIVTGLVLTGFVVGLMRRLRHGRFGWHRSPPVD